MLKVIMAMSRDGLEAAVGADFRRAVLLVAFVAKADVVPWAPAALRFFGFASLLACDVTEFAEDAASLAPRRFIRSFTRFVSPGAVPAFAGNFFAVFVVAAEDTKS